MGLIVTVLKALLYANNLLPKKSKYMSTNLSRRLLTLAQLYPALSRNVDCDVTIVRSWKILFNLVENKLTIIYQIPR